MSLDYEVGIGIESKERLVNLVEKHNGNGLFDLDFSQALKDAPDDDKYPQMLTFDIPACPIGFSVYSAQLRKIVDDGYTVQVKKN